MSTDGSAIWAGLAKTNRCCSSVKRGSSATIDGSGVGGTLPGTTESRGGRVTGRFTVPKREGTTPAPPPAPQP